MQLGPSSRKLGLSRLAIEAGRTNICKNLLVIAAQQVMCFLCNVNPTADSFQMQYVSRWYPMVFPMPLHHACHEENKEVGGFEAEQ